MAGLIGRTREVSLLDRYCESGRPELVAIYGRYRVGKTFLVRNYFGDAFSFYATGIANQNTRAQLRAFNRSLIEYGALDRGMPSDWFEAFAHLKALLSSETVRRDRASGRRVVFLDELPWFDTPRSSFKAALDWFWNGWASARNDVMLIACGSATSWMPEPMLFVVSMMQAATSAAWHWPAMVLTFLGRHEKSKQHTTLARKWQDLIICDAHRFQRGCANKLPRSLGMNWIT